MRKFSGFSLTVIALLGLGIGATTAVFSLIDAILLKPVPYPDSATLVIPWNIPPAGVNIGGFEEFPGAPFIFGRWSKRRKPFVSWERSRAAISISPDRVTLPCSKARSSRGNFSLR
jgi:hypothetical protein